MAPDIKHELDRPDSDHNHWLEINKVSDTQINVEKKDSMPVFNEDKYTYRIQEDGSLEFESGRHSCSGAGKTRSKSPSDELDKKIRELCTPLTPGV